MVQVSSVIDSETSITRADMIGRIPVRNLWLLMLYASDLFRNYYHGRISVEENPEDIPNIVAEILVRMVEYRLKRNLSFGFREKEAVLNRVRGRIDHLITARHRLLQRGKIACRYEFLTVNTTRNRYVRAALEKLSKVVSVPHLAHRCTKLANSLYQLGVVGERPPFYEVSTERYGRHEIRDLQMVTAAHLAFELALPTEDSGSRSLFLLDREVAWVWKLFEKGIAGFYDVVLSPLGWKVSAGKKLKWQIDEETAGISDILPGMITDIILENSTTKRRIVIDTKFTSILKPGRFGGETLSSGYIYQIYTYLRSQESADDPLSLNSSGLLLHPSIGSNVNETVTIQDHVLRFSTVDLTRKANEIRKQLLHAVNIDVNEISNESAESSYSNFWKVAQNRELNTSIC